MGGWRHLKLKNCLLLCCSLWSCLVSCGVDLVFVSDQGINSYRRTKKTAVSVFSPLWFVLLQLFKYFIIKFLILFYVIIIQIGSPSNRVHPPDDTDKELGIWIINNYFIRPNFLWKGKIMHISFIFLILQVFIKKKRQKVQWLILTLMELVREPQVTSHGNGLGTPSYNFSLFSIFDPCKKRKASKFQALKSHGMKTFVKKV